MKFTKACKGSIKTLTGTAIWLPIEKRDANITNEWCEKQHTKFALIGGLSFVVAGISTFVGVVSTYILGKYDGAQTFNAAIRRDGFKIVECEKENNTEEKQEEES